MRIPCGDHAELSTEHATSSHGVPVLVIQGEAYGAADRLPAGWRGLRGGEAMTLWCAMGRTPEERQAARAYCAQWPEGPQIAPEPARALGRRGGLAGRGASQRRGGGTPEEVSVHMRALGARGGAAGRGAKKARAALPRGGSSC